VRVENPCDWLVFGAIDTRLPNRVSPLTSLVCVAALGIGGCGSGGNAGNGGNGLSKAEFVRRAETICAKTSAKQRAILDAPQPDHSIERMKKIYAEQLVPTFREEIDQLRALKPPKNDREMISKALDDASAGVVQIAAAYKSVNSESDIASLPTPPRLKAAAEAMRAYGLRKCANG
jgi:hypothetical protein